jgi:riboflavin kinase / FMN adenylyltransferase
VQNQKELKVFNDIADITASNPVVTIGIFDGVHQGHVEILRKIKKLAREYEGESVVITLWPHPRFVLQPENKELKLLTSLDEKIELISKQGIDKVLILPFTKELSNTPYDLFIKNYIVDRIGARHVVVGFNHHFGKDRKGTFESLQKSARQFNIQAERLDPVIQDETRISSSGIRHMLEEGRISAANKALGYSYFLNGTVVHGKQLGRTLGFPTANIMPLEPLKLVPRTGIYAARVKLEGKEYPGMLSIGYRPTVETEKHERTIEVNIFDFDADIYDQPIQIIFEDWLRNEIKFNSLRELRDQIATDKLEVLKLFRTNKGIK